MKKIIFLSIVLLKLNILSAQKPGSNFTDEDTRQVEQVKKPTLHEFNPQNVIGILKYDEVRVIRKIKLFNEEKINKTKQLIINYNNDIDQFSLLNVDFFNGFKTYIETKRKSIINKRYSSMMEQIELEIQLKLLPFKNQIEKKEASLNSKIKALLSEKQFKKWLRYQKSLKYNLKRKGG